MQLKILTTNLTHGGSAASQSFFVVIIKKMKQNLAAILVIFLLAEIGYSQQVSYKIGDTLNVFTIGGLKLREGTSLSSRVLTSMKLGDKVVVKNVFQHDPEYFQIIEGFTGHWVRIKYDTLEGFAFDGF
jgi:Bacterial SH3 domain